MQRYDYAIAQYLDDLASEDQSKKSEAALHLTEIFISLGKGRINKEMIEFLKGRVLYEQTY